MPEMVLPGVYIEVRAEGLITPGRVTVGNIGMLGTASKGPVNEPVLLSSASEAREIFGPYDAWKGGSQNELSLGRALELAYANGASAVFAVRVASGGQSSASLELEGTAASTKAAKLEGKTPGTAGNSIGVNVSAAEDGAFIENEEHAGAASVTLSRKPVAKVARNRVRVKFDATGQTKEFNIKYNPDPAEVDVVQINDATGAVTFHASQVPAAADKVIVSYEVPAASSVKVTVRAGTTDEVFTVADGAHLVQLVNDTASPSQLVKGVAAANPTEVPKKSATAEDFLLLKGGNDGAAVNDTHFATGLELLLNEQVHIVVAAGMDNETFGAELKAHCDTASTDKMKADRIAVTGSKVNASFNDIRGHKVDSDRVVFVAPGFKATDSVSGQPSIFPGSYTAAVIAGMLSSLSPHISLTNKPVAVDELQTRFTQPQLEQLVQARVFVIEEQRGRGIRVVKGITTSTNSAFHQITTRRIVDFAKYGVRSAASPYIGKLNNERVRAALRSTISSFLQEMLDDEMLTAFEVEVSATRADEIKGIANVTILLQPTFSIDFIKVTMVLA
jgi:hypothetical protein